MLAIFKKDFTSYFTNTLGYIVLGMYLLLSGFFFWLVCFQSAYNSLVDVINSMLYVVFFLLPLVTMKSFAEEKRQKTDQALLTAPVKIWEIVLGKYMSAMALYLICNMVYFLYAFVLQVTVAGVTIAWGKLFAGLIGSVMLGAAILAINLFYSSLTEYQIIAAVVGLGTGLFFMIYDSVLGSVKNFIYSLFQVEYKFIVLDKLSLTTHYMNFINGMFNPADLVFYLTWIGLFLFLTGRVLDKKRWA